jgi:hypothetical protein
MNAQDAMQELNELYMGWHQHNKSTKYGVTIRFIQTGHIMEEGHHWYYCHDSCTQGFNDCRVSASLLNNQTMVCRGDCKVDQDDNTSYPAYAQGAMHTSIGVAFNQTYVENEVGKCYYQFDGSSTYRYNHGCGCGANNDVMTDCKSPQSPYNNIDPKTGKQMDSSSAEVADCHCGDGRLAKPMPKTTLQSQCYWKGPAFDTSAGDGINELSNMMDQRMSNQHGYDVVQAQNRSRLAYWNEVVIDGDLLTQQLAVDPSVAITAVIWMMTGNRLLDKNTFSYANKLAEYFRTAYGFTSAPAVVALDQRVDVRKRGPFEVAQPLEESFI